MRKKIKLVKKYNYKLKRVDIIIIIVIFIIISVFLCFKYINKEVLPTIQNYANEEVKKLTSYIINISITDDIINQLDNDNLFIINKNNNNDINTVDFNPIIVNKILVMITNNIYKNLKNLEKGKIELIDLESDYINNDITSLKQGIVFNIPSGITFGNPILSNIGPKVPVKLNLVGNVITNVNTKIENYGINNALIKIFVDISLTEQVVLPFTSKKIVINSQIPLTMKLISGSVPNYYFNGIDKNSTTYTLPNAS